MRSLDRSFVPSFVCSSVRSLVVRSFSSFVVGEVVCSLVGSFGRWKVAVLVSWLVS